jgi:Domain of unknown function (DUF1876)
MMQQTNSELDIKRWSIVISIRETDKGIVAEAHLFRPGTDLTGVGLLPLEQQHPLAAEIGDELAAARALSDLATQLFSATVSDLKVSKQATAATQ